MMTDKHITIGVAGHVDHGKTSLVKALTGIDTDRLKEEKRRGLSIESGIAPMEISSGETVAFVDVPGHIDFMKNTIRGLSTVDAAILVVAADDGVMPQTREHLEVLRFLGAETGFVVLSKADLVDAETLELAELEVTELLEGTFLETQAVLPFSALDRRGMDHIRIQIEHLQQACRGKSRILPFRLWIDRIRGVQGFGTVVSGTVLSGKVRENDALVILPPGMETRVRSLEGHHKRVPEAVAGQRVGVSLHKVQLQDVDRGMLLTVPGAVLGSRYINVDLSVLAGAKKPLKNGQKVKMYLGTSVANTRVVLMEGAHMAPGDRGLAQLQFASPFPVSPLDAFVLCLLDVPAVIGGGKVLEARSQKHRKAKVGTILPYLKALQDRNLRATLHRFFDYRPARPATLKEMAEATGFSTKDLEGETRRMTAQKTLLLLRDRRFIQRASYEAMKLKLLEAIRAALKGNALKDAVNTEEARTQARLSVEPGVVQEILEDLCRDGSLTKFNGGYRCHETAGKLSREQENLIGLLLDFAAKSKLNPFSADTVWKAHEKRIEKKVIQKHLDYLKAQGKLAILGDKRFLSVEALEEAKRRVGNVIKQKGAFTIPDCKETLGYGRTVAIPVLEYLDTIGFTRRQGDERVFMNDNS
ncbi:MAG: selenocysteine-specific translation elongation factor [Desulfatiglandales bacterium]